MNSSINNINQSLLGLAVGDALGSTLEFKKPGSFQTISTIVGGGFHDLKPGQWTDDTSMALCLAQSLIDCKTFNPKDQMDKYSKWEEEGYMSSTGICFDIGTTTSLAIDDYALRGNAFATTSGDKHASNGSIMRLAPIPMHYYHNPEDAIKYAVLSSKTTHANILCVDACRYMTGVMVGLLNGVDKETVLSSMYSPIKNYYIKEPLCNEIKDVALGSFKEKKPPEIKGSGYVVESLEAALWAFYNTDNFRDGA